MDSPSSPNLRSPAAFANRIGKICAVGLTILGILKTGHAATGFFGDGTGAAIFYVTDGSTTGEGTYKNVGSLNNFDYGDFIVLNGGSNTLLLRGGEGKTYKNSGGDVYGVTEYYRIYVDGATPGSYTSFALPFSADLGGGDQRWKKTDQNVNLLSGLTQSGRYVVEYYWEQTGNQGTNYMSNGGSNYKTYFDLNYEINTSSTVTQNTIGGAATLSGNGTFVKKGTGSVQINANNSAYTGNAYVDQGTIEFQAGSFLTSGSITLGPESSAGTGVLTISDSDGGTNVGNQIVVRANGAGSTIGATNTSGTNSYSGSIYLDGNASTSSSSGGTLSLNGTTIDLKSQTLTIGGAGNTAVSAAIANTSGSGNLIISTTGTASLSSANTYTGNTTVSAGTLQITNASALGGTGNGTTVASGATLALSGGIAVLSENLTISGSGVGGGGALRNLSGNNRWDTTGVTITLAADSTIGSDSGTFTLNRTSGSFITGSGYTLTLVGAGNFAIQNSLALGAGGLTMNGTGTITLGSAASSSYTGATTINSGTFSLANNDRINDSSSLIVNGGVFSMATRNETVAGVKITGGNITSTTGILTSSSTYDLQSGNITAILAGSNGATKTTAGTVTLSGVNTYTGTTSINAGTVLINNASALGNGGNITFGGGGLQYGTGITADLSSRLKNSASAILVDTNNNNVTFASAIDSSNVGGLTKTGSGTLTLNGTNTYTGATTVNAGTLATSAADGITDSSAVTVGSGAVLQLGGSETVGSIAGAGNYSLGAYTLTAGGDNTSTTVSGVLSSTGGGLTKAGSGTLTLNGTNTYTGTTTINAGTLEVTGGSAIVNTGTVTLGNATGATFLVSASETIASLQGGGTLGGNVSIASGQTLTDAEANTFTYNGILTGAGTFAKSAAGSLTLSNAGSTLSGGVWVQQGTLYAAGIGNAAASSYLGSCGTIKLGNSSNSATLRLTGASSETTDKIIDLSGTTGGGTLTIDSSAATYTFSNSFTATGVGAKTLSLNGAGTSSGGFVLNGAIVNSSSGATSLSVGGSGSLTVTLGCATNSFSGPVSIVGNTAGKTYTLQVAGIGNTGNTSYLGTNSTINIGAGTGGTNILKYTGTGETTDKVINLASNNNNNQATLDASNASGLLKFTSNFTATGTASNKILNLIGTGNAEIAGAIVNNSVSNVTNLTKSGAGTWTLSGNNTYTGTTTISGGTLVINGTNSGSAITVNSGGTLAGTGTGGTTTINAGGKIGPGNSPGILTVGDLTLNGNGTYTWEMADATGVAGTGWDQINATGLLTVGSNATSTFKIAITSSGAPANWNYTTTNQSWDIIDYGTISGFNASYFTLNTTAFAGDLTADSSWALSDTGSALRLTYTYTALSPTYAGGTGNWSTGFTPAITNSANATFVGAGGTATNNIASATLSNIGSLTFDGTNSYTLEANSGSAGFNSASALAIGGTIVNNSSVAQTVNLATSFAASQTINANTGSLLIGGNLSVGTGAILTVLGSNSTTISGVVSGLGGLTKNSSSTLTLSGNNSYSGNTIIGQGKVLIGDNNAFGTGSVKLGISGVTANITLASTDGTARTISNELEGVAGNSWTTTFGEASGGTGDLSFTNTTAVNLNGTSRTFNVLNTTTFANAFVSTSGSLIKSGTGTMILTGASTYGGGTTINAGTLQIGNGLTTGSLNATSTITNNANLVFNRSNTMTQGAAFGTVIAGSGNVTQAGTGTLVLSGVNTYTGSTTVSTGNITISNASALGGTGTGTTVASGAALQIQGDIAVGAEALTLAGSGFSNAGALRNLSGANSYAGAITLSDATTIGSDAGTLTLSGGISGTQNLTLVGAGNMSISAGIATSTGTLTKNGAGTVALGASNSFTGSTTINGGTLQAAAANALGSTSSIIVNTGGSLLVTANGSVNNSAGVDLAGGTLAFSGALNETFGALTLSANSSLDFGTDSVVAMFSSLAMNGYALSVYNWTGTTLWDGGTGNNTDQFYVNSALGDSDLSRISFYSTSLESSFLGNGYQIMGGGFANQVIPVPEPETYATAVVLLLVGTFWTIKNRRRKKVCSA